MIIYILNAEGTWEYKIGHTKSNSSKGRLKQCQTGNSLKIATVWEYTTDYAKEVEKMMHRYLTHCRQAGEWFSLGDYSIDDIKNKIIHFDKVVKQLNYEEENSNRY